MEYWLCQFMARSKKIVNNWTISILPSKKTKRHIARIGFVTILFICPAATLAAEESPSPCVSQLAKDYLPQLRPVDFHPISSVLSDGSLVDYAVRTVLQNMESAPPVLKNLFGYQPQDSTENSNQLQKPSPLAYKKYENHISMSRFIKSKPKNSQIKKVVENLHKLRALFFSSLIQSTPGNINRYTLQPTRITGNINYENWILEWPTLDLKVIVPIRKAAVNPDTLEVAISGISVTHAGASYNFKANDLKNFVYAKTEPKATAVPSTKKQKKQDTWKLRSKYGLAQISQIVDKYELESRSAIERVETFAFPLMAANHVTIEGYYNSLSYKYTGKSHHLRDLNTYLSSNGEAIAISLRTRNLQVGAYISWTLKYHLQLSEEEYLTYLRAFALITTHSSNVKSEIFHIALNIDKWLFKLPPQVLKPIVEEWLAGRLNLLDKPQLNLQVNPFPYNRELQLAKLQDHLSTMNSMKHLERDFDTLARKTRRIDKLTSYHQRWAMDEVDSAFLDIHKGFTDKYIGLTQDGILHVQFISKQKVFAVGHEAALNFHGFLSDNEKNPIGKDISRPNSNARGKKEYTDGELRYYAVIFPLGFIDHYGAKAEKLKPKNKRHITIPSMTDFLAGTGFEDYQGKAFPILYEAATKEQGQVHINLTWDDLIINGQEMSHMEFLRTHALGVVEFNSEGLITHSLVFQN